VTAPRGSIPSALAPDDVVVWLLDPAGLQGAVVRAAALALLTADERKRAERFVFDADRDISIGARALARTLLLAYSGAARSHDLAFVFNDHGKPSLAGTVNGRRLAFNLSHTRGLVACAVAWDAELGVDVETVRDNPPLSVAQSYFAGPEIDALQALAPDARADAFYATWTLKESFIKARGQGLAIPLDSFAVRLQPPALLPYGAMAATHTDWRFAQLRPLPGFIGAVCWSRVGGPAAIGSHWLTPDAILAAAARA
jgi:4'-phosphopantetheinyl transferase